jgi:hypothetical protein
MIELGLSEEAESFGFEVLVTQSGLRSGGQMPSCGRPTILSWPILNSFHLAAYPSTCLTMTEEGSEYCQ